MCVCVYIYIYIYTYIHAYIHTYIHIHIHIDDIELYISTNVRHRVIHMNLTIITSSKYSINMLNQYKHETINHSY